MMMSDESSATFGPSNVNLSLAADDEAIRRDSTTSNENAQSQHQFTSFTTTAGGAVNDVPLISAGGTTLRERGPGGLGAGVCGRSPNYDLGDVTQKLDHIKQWGISTYKCTKQAIYEHLGKTARTVDLELEQKIEQLKELQKRYNSLLALSKAFSTHFYNMTAAQKQMADLMAEMSQKEPLLREQFGFNAESQKAIHRNGEALAGSLASFISSMQTLCEKTMDDTLLTVRQFDAARLQYDAYRGDLAAMQQGGTQHGGDFQGKLHMAEENCAVHKRKYEQLRDDVQVKMKFLDENRTKVMSKQLVTLHAAICAYFGGNHQALEAAGRQFASAATESPAHNSSFLEH